MAYILLLFMYINKITFVEIYLFFILTVITYCKINSLIIPINRKGNCHGLVCWTEWCLDTDKYVSFGASNRKTYNSEWYPYVRQRVYFLNTFKNVFPGDIINCDAILSKNGNLLISFCNTYDH